MMNHMPLPSFWGLLLRVLWQTRTTRASRSGSRSPNHTRYRRPSRWCVGVGTNWEGKGGSSPQLRDAITYLRSFY
jgi:hypothetical protein